MLGMSLRARWDATLLSYNDKSRHWKKAGVDRSAFHMSYVTCRPYNYHVWWQCISVLHILYKHALKNHCSHCRHFPRLDSFLNRLHAFGGNQTRPSVGTTGTTRPHNGGLALTLGDSDNRLRRANTFRHASEGSSDKTTLDVNQHFISTMPHLS